MLPLYRNPSLPKKIIKVDLVGTSHQALFVTVYWDFMSVVVICSILFLEGLVIWLPRIFRRSLRFLRGWSGVTSVWLDDRGIGVICVSGVWSGGEDNEPCTRTLYTAYPATQHAHTNNRSINMTTATHRSKQLCNKNMTEFMYITIIYTIIQGRPKKWEHLSAYCATRCSRFSGSLCKTNKLFNQNYDKMANCSNTSDDK